MLSHGPGRVLHEQPYLQLPHHAPAQSVVAPSTILFKLFRLLQSGYPKIRVKAEQQAPNSLELKNSTTTFAQPCQSRVGPFASAPPKAEPQYLPPGWSAIAPDPFLRSIERDPFSSLRLPSFEPIERSASNCAYYFSHLIADIHLSRPCITQ